MRRVSGVLGGLCLLLATGSQAKAQGPGFFGVDPTAIQFKPIDTSKAIAPVPQQTRSTGFRVMDLLPRFPFNFGKPAVGTSAFPAPVEMLRAVNYHTPYWSPPPIKK